MDITSLRTSLPFGLIVIILLILGDGTTGQVDSGTANGETLSGIEGLQMADRSDSDPGPKINELMPNQTVDEGDGSVKFECQITGSPIPTYSWSKDGAIIDNRNTDKYRISTIGWGSRLRVNRIDPNDAGRYTCVGSIQDRSVNVSALLCVRSAAPTQTTAQSQPDDPLWADFPSSDVRPNIIKSDDAVLEPFCQDFAGGYCNGWLAGRSIYVRSRTQQYNADKAVVDTVTNLGARSINSDSECFQQSIKVKCYFSNPMCSPSGQPQRLCRDECEALYPVCRNDFESDDWHLLPTCSDLDNSPGCIRIGLVPQTTASPLLPRIRDEKTKDDVTVLLVTVVLPIILGLLAILAIVLTVVCVCKRRKSQEARSPPSTDSVRLSSVTGSSKCYEMAPGSDKSSTVFMKDIPLDNIHLIQELGAGVFGKIHKGQCFGLYGNGTSSMVFVKTLNAQASIAQQQEFQNEMNVMTELRHQHVITLLGISTKGTTQSILYEHLPMGDLKQFLLTQEAHGSPLQHKEVMYILTQMASGLEYLASQSFIHRDIAARNIVVGQNLNVKLSNLKIVYGLHSTDYSHIHNSLMPIRWLPPESITYSQFTLETDIYMYGVLMWEVFSSGQQPYSGFSNEDVVEMVRSRQLLACPADCPPRIYSLMMECWHEKQNKRPLAKEVHQKMRAWYLDNSNVFSMGSTTAPSVSNSTAPSHHSSTGPGNPSNKTNMTDIRSPFDPSGTPLSHQTSTRIPDHPPYYSTLYTEGMCQDQTTPCNVNGKCQGHTTDDSSSDCSDSSIEDDDESEFTMPTPVKIQNNQFNSLNRKAMNLRVDYRGHTNKPYVPQDHV